VREMGASRGPEGAARGPRRRRGDMVPGSGNTLRGRTASAEGGSAAAKTAQVLVVLNGRRG